MAHKLKPLPNVSEPYASMTREQLVDEIDRFAQNYNALTRARDCLKHQKEMMQSLAEDGLLESPRELNIEAELTTALQFLKQIKDVDCPHDNEHPKTNEERIQKLEAALRAVRPFFYPDIQRGPASLKWMKARRLMNQAIEFSEEEKEEVADSVYDVYDEG